MDWLWVEFGIGAPFILGNVMVRCREGGDVVESVLAEAVVAVFGVWVLLVRAIMIRHWSNFESFLDKDLLKSNFI